MDRDRVAKWAAGPSYGPVLSQTDLYLLRDIQLEIHPVLANIDEGFQLNFDLSTGHTSGHRPGGDRDLEFTAKSEPATIPRVSELMIITHKSPWCTIVKNPEGVTCGDICETLFREYTEREVTQAELNSLPPRAQDSINRFRDTAMRHGAQWGPGAYFNQPPAPGMTRRIG
ncbi:unnamed protein product [Somion occarium]|uniref:DUF6699 domain-containing protein n=1 Tax=Somion occarium TaxID=3059160 RepID=A0ABP1D5Z4_9APHY